MALLESKDICELVAVEDDAAFQEFAAGASSGIAMRSEEYGESKQVVLKSDAGHFAKWLRTHDANISVTLDEKKPRLVLHSGDVWLPLVFLANDVALPIYLNLVASFLYEKMKGALKGDTARVRLSAEFEDKVSGKVKRFTFEGDVEALQKAIKRFDLNAFFDE